jgi:hypothetical protein
MAGALGRLPGPEIHMTKHRVSTANTVTTLAKAPMPVKSSARRPVRGRPATANSQPVTPAERHRMIAEVAYFIAERRGFTPGSELEDWFRAEAEIGRRLGEGTAG